MTAAILEVRGLTVSIDTPAGVITPVEDVSLSARPGRTLAIVGESGSGKSLTCLSLIGGLPRSAAVTRGSVLFEGQELVGRSEAEWRAIRGRRMGLILQDPITSLNPMLTIGEQIGEMFRHHQGLTNRRQIREKVVGALAAVQIPAPSLRVDSYPHQFSGGMRQRAAIAMAIACEPSLLIADEPTTALDATIRLQILRLLRDLQRRTGMAIVFVTHDLNLVRHFCDDVAVMYAGRVVEQGAVNEVFDRPRHPYAAALIAAAPRLHAPSERLLTIDGHPPRFEALPPGCRFAPRCGWADSRCIAAYPPQNFAGGSVAECWKPIQMPRVAVAR